ncbi:MAG: hypothetical protein EA412_00645 [Chitinophagaceae bacterium]|nr:MAG: hypothetical protein EA412_00645 [Chitinophagaceae bacterium]
MKNKNLWLIICISIILCGCEDLLKLDDEKNIFKIDEKTALVVAENLLFPPPHEGGLDEQILKQEDYTINKEVLDISHLLTEKNEPFVYIINFKNGGFVLLSADMRLEPVIAYSEINQFYLNPNEPVSPGVLHYLAAHKERLVRMLESGIIPKNAENNMAAWEKLSKQFVIVRYAGDYINCNNVKETKIVRKKLLKTIWGQLEGYNNSLDNMGCTLASSGGKPPVGCVATAIGQILKFHAENDWNGTFTYQGVPHIYFWENMPYHSANQSSDPNLPSLMKVLGKMLNMSYACNGSGARFNRAYDAFRSILGFPYATKENKFIYTEVINNINNNRPVFMAGCSDETQWIFGLFSTYKNCHAWVAEGYSQVFDCENNTMTNNHKIYMNWGWEGNHDGWYLHNKEWDAGSSTYNYNRKMIRRIIPE